MNHPESIDSDQVLIDRAKTDPEAFGLVFERHFDSIFGYVFRRTGDWEAARDLSSETFLKALRGLPRFRWRGKPVSAWLFAIATNELRMYFRRGRRTCVWLDDFLREGSLTIPGSPSMEVERRTAEEELDRSQEFVRVRRALEHLPFKYQEVIALRFFEEKTIAEIAEILGRPEGTVKSLVSRGLERLRRALEQTQPSR